MEYRTVQLLSPTDVGSTLKLHVPQSNRESGRERRRHSYPYSSGRREGPRQLSNDRVCGLGNQEVLVGTLT